MDSGPGHRPALGAALIALGVAALLGRLIDGFPSLWETAPAIAAVYLAVRIPTHSNPGARPWLLLAVAMLILWQVAIVAGLALDGNLIWPLLIIAVGVAMLANARRRRRGGGDGGGGDATALFGHVQRRVSGPLPEPLPVSALFGSCEFDLREAELDQAAGRIEASVTFGSIELRLPADWSVDSSGVTATFGSVTDRDPPGGAAADLKLTGSALFGSIEIKR